MQKPFIIITFGIMALLGGGVLYAILQSPASQSEVSNVQQREEAQIDLEKESQEERELALFNIELSRSEADEQRNDAFYSIIDLEGNSTEPEDFTFLEGVTNPGFNWVLSPDKTKIAQFSDTSVYITDTKDFSWEEVARFELEEGSRISGITIGSNNSRVIIQVANPPELTPEEKERQGFLPIFKPAIFDLYIVDIETGEQEEINIENVDITLVWNLGLFDEENQKLYYYDVSNGNFTVGFGKLDLETSETQILEVLKVGGAEYSQDFTTAYIMDENSGGILKVNLESMQGELFYEASTYSKYYLRQDKLFVAEQLDDEPGIQKSIKVVSTDTREEKIIFPEWNFGQGASNDSINISPDGAYLIMQNQDNQSGHSLYSLDGAKVELINENFADGKYKMGTWIYR